MRTQTIVTTDATIFVLVTESPVALAAVWRVDEGGIKDVGVEKESDERRRDGWKVTGRDGGEEKRRERKK
jgi:hypothetical protein